MSPEQPRLRTSAGRKLTGESDRARAVWEHLEADGADAGAIARNQSKRPATGTRHVHYAWTAWNGDDRGRLALWPAFDDELTRFTQHPQDFVVASVDPWTRAGDQPGGKQKCDGIARRGHGPGHRPRCAFGDRPAALSPLGRFGVCQHRGGAAASDGCHRWRGLDRRFVGRLVARCRSNQNDQADRAYGSRAHDRRTPAGPHSFPKRTLMVP